MLMSTVLVAIGLCLVREASSQLQSSGSTRTINPLMAGTNGVAANPAVNGQTIVGPTNGGTSPSTLPSTANGLNSISSNSFGQSVASFNAGPPIFRAGLCRFGNIFVDANYNSDSLFSENGGRWIVSGVPATPENSALMFALAFLTPVNGGSQPRLYNLTFYTQVPGENLKIGLKLVLQDLSQSFVTVATTIPDLNQPQITYYIFYLAHFPGVWSYLYICSNQYGNSGVDYRYLLTHGNPLTQQDLQTVNQIDQTNQFRGQLAIIY